MKQWPLIWHFCCVKDFEIGRGGKVGQGHNMPPAVGMEIVCHDFAMAQVPVAIRA